MGTTTSGSAEDAGVAQGVAAGLGPDRQAVRLGPHLDLRDQVPVGGVERVHDAVVAAGEPKHLAVGRQAAHVGAATAGDLPLGDQLVGGEVENGDRTLTAVRDVHHLRVAAHVQAVRAI